MSPVIFNVMVDAVVRHWRAKDSTGIDLETLLFYADDGLLAGTDTQQVQESLDVITKRFLSVGLKMNATKTEYMTMEGGKRVVRLSKEAYERQCTGRGKTHRQKSLEKVMCELCGTKQVNRQHLPVHQKRDTCKNGRKEYVPPRDIMGGQRKKKSSFARGCLFVDALLCFFISLTVKLAKTHKIENTTTPTRLKNFNKPSAPFSSALVTC
jgi:hypothetical protein